MKIKKLFLTAVTTLSALCAIFAVSLTASASIYGAKYGDLTYSIDYNDTVEITDCDESVTEVTIPSEIDGYPVTSIGYDAFSGCSSLTSITIPDNVTSIGSSAFYNCSSLTSITIPDNVTSIGSSAFYNCSSLTSITIPDSVTAIGGSAFYNCSSLTSITIPDGMTSIGSGAFYNTAYYNDESNWENGVLYIGNALINTKSSVSGDYAIKNGTHVVADNAFRYRYNLTSVTIPDSVTSIGDSAFGSCSKLSSITISDSVTSIGDYAFDDTAYYRDESNWENGVLYIGNALIKAKSSVSGDYAIKNGTRVVANRAFEFLRNLTSITLPDSMTSIGEYAFSDCNNLTDVYVSSLKTWLNIGFDTGIWGWSDIRSLYIDGELLTDVVIPQGIERICASAFYNCESITSVTIPESVKSIGEYAFYGCDNLTEVHVPNVEAWLSLTFEGYGANPVSTYREVDTFLYINGERPTTIVIPQGVEKIPNEAFWGWDSLTSITIPNSVTSIGSSAFSSCEGLTSITIPESVVSIGNSAFSSCGGLTSVVIPASVTFIGDGAFEYCWNLESITVDVNNPSYLSDAYGVLYNKDKTTLIQAPVEANLGNYVIPNTVTNIRRNAFYNCDNLTSVTIPESVTLIGEKAFIYCYRLKSITVDVNNPSYLSDSCGVLFNKDKTELIQAPAKANLGNYAVPNTVTNIHDNAFNGCDSLTSVTIPESVAKIGGYSAEDSWYYHGYVFSNCVKLESITVDESNTTFVSDENGYLFNKNKTLLIQVPDAKTSANIPASVTDIFDGTFGYKIESITVDENNQNYSSDARGVLFNKDKTNLIEAPKAMSGSYEIPSGVKVIEYGAFLNCNLTDVTIPTSVTAIYNQAFDYCGKLTDIYYKGSENEWNKISLGSHYSDEWKNVTIHYGSAPTVKKGDIDDDGDIDIDDAVLLFRHSMLPDTYPISYSGSLDINADGKVDIDDAVLLFRHSMLPDLYPIG